MKKTVEKKITPTKKSSSARHFAHVGRAMHHHKAHAHMPKFFYHKGSLFPNLTWKISFVTLIVFSLLYFIATNLPSDNPSTDELVTPASFKFVFDGKAQDWGVDPDSLKVHGAAAGEFDFLFQEDSSSDVSTLPNMPSSSDSTTGITIPSKDVDVSVGSDTDLGGFDNDTSTPIAVSKGLSCKTPWGDSLEDGDFVLAYQQRTDVNDLCNVQKRYCTNGTLNGSYTQQSCKEDLTYSYTKVEPIAQNDPNKVDPYIQPSDPKNNGANFDNNGKITTTTKPTDTRSDSGISSTSSTGPYVTHVNSNSSSSCQTPWGASVADGQFVRAYKSPIGLTDMPCEVQIRLCSKGSLKGTFRYSSCNVKNMTYSDYLLDKGENSDTPNIIDMTNAVMTTDQKDASLSPGFWNWLSKYF